MIVRSAGDKSNASRIFLYIGSVPTDYKPFEKANHKLLTGHHRPHSPILHKAVEIVKSGVLGQLVGVIGSAVFYKPDSDGYFDPPYEWRRQPGGGPILLNLIHEINNLQSLVGDIVGVRAVTTNAFRGYPVEDTAAMVFTFANGALGTFLLSDTAASARSWEQTSGENPDYAGYPDEDCYHIAGTMGSLSIPTMRLKVYTGARSWYSPFDSSVAAVDRSDPLVHQIAHFADVIRGLIAEGCPVELQIVDGNR